MAEMFLAPVSNIEGRFDSSMPPITTTGTLTAPSTDLSVGSPTGLELGLVFVLKIGPRDIYEGLSFAVD